MTHSSIGRLSGGISEQPFEAPPGELRTANSYILVVDDEAVVRAFLTRCLEEAGYTVKQAGSSAEALQMMMSDPAAAVLCDIRMPGQDGLWLVERLHTHWPEVPVVMASALDDLQTMRKCRELGAVDYIAKPIKAEQLIGLLRRVTATLPAEESIGREPALPEQPPKGTDEQIDAEYVLETSVRCPACGERVTTLKAVRLIRVHVNFTSTLPRRGRVVACPNCLAIVPAELTNF
jgi:CheY-like chemotaxis protein